MHGSAKFAALIWVVWVIFSADGVWAEQNQQKASSTALPEDVALFLHDYAQAVKKSRVDNIMDHYSDRFMLGSRDKQGTEAFWKAVIRRGPVKSFQVVLSGFKQRGDKAEVAGTVMFNGRKSPLQIKSIIMEKGRWKWYGLPIQSVKVAGLDVSFADPMWDGKAVPQGQQCLRFGGRPLTPSVVVNNIPLEANAILMEYSDRDWPPMDNGGHGRIGYIVEPGCRKIQIPAVPGHTFQLPDGFFLLEAHRGSQWDKAGAYMPPCSGGRGNHYYVTVKAVKRSEGQGPGRLLAKGILEMGAY